MAAKALQAWEASDPDLVAQLRKAGRLQPLLQSADQEAEKILLQVREKKLQQGARPDSAYLAAEEVAQDYMNTYLDQQENRR